MSNIIKAILNIAKTSNFELKNNGSGRNAINNVGEALEVYIQNSLC